MIELEMDMVGEMDGEMDGWLSGVNGLLLLFYKTSLCG